MELGYILSIFWFAFISWSYGYSVLWLTKTTLHKNPLLRFVETFAIGFATFSFLAVILDLLHIPLLLPLYIILGLIVPITAAVLEFKGLRTNTQESSWELRESICILLVFIAATGVFILLYRGANAYPYLEDDDPWSHVQSVSYIGRMHTYDVPVPPDHTGPTYAFYLEPYPPNYDVIMGLEWQQNRDAVWTLKFFNALICALAIVFAFILAKEYLGSPEKGAFAAILLAALPSFMSHFIWSQTLALAIFPVAFYAFLRSLKEKSWRIPAVIAIASMMVSQPIVSVVFGIVIIIAVLLIFLQETMTARNEKTQKNNKTAKNTKSSDSFLKQVNAKITSTYATTTTAILVAGGGLLVSMLYWIYQLIKRGMLGILTQHGNVASKDVSGWVTDYTLQKYSLMETIFAPHSSRIDQATGFGLFFTILLVASIIVLLVLWRRTFSLSKGWMHIHLLLWSALLLYIVFAPSFGIPSFGSSRFWAYLAIPLALLVAEGTFIIVSSITKHEAAKIVILLVLAGLVVITSLPAKIDVQTAQWPPGVHWYNPMMEIPGYMETQQTLPRNTRIFAFCGGDLHPMGFNFQSDPWDPEVIAMRKNLGNATGQEIVAFLKKKNFEYVTITVGCIRDLGENGTNDLANKISATGNFVPVINRQDRPGFILAKVQ